VLDALKEGSLQFFDPEAQGLMFLHRALQQRGNLHIIFNALKDAFTSIPEWKTMETLLKAVAKMCGEFSYKERLLERCFKRAPRHARYLLHRFAGAHVDWRWQFLEDVSEQIVAFYEYLREFWDPREFADEG
jgi:hypothetical protein